MNHSIREMAAKAVEAKRALVLATTGQKNDALALGAALLEKRADSLCKANEQDRSDAEASRISAAMLDRLTLTGDRVAAMAQGLRAVAALPDPIGEIVDEQIRPNGLKVLRVRIPLGVIGMIYESRPNVTADAAALCLKSGNAAILRGGREALHTNQAIAELWRRACVDAKLPADAVQLITDPDYSILDEMLLLDRQIDLIIPRGGEALIRRVSEKSRIPVLKHAKGVCHVYVDEHADLGMAVAIAVNAKVQRPGVCNAMETLLVHEKVAARFLPQVVAALRGAGVLIRGCARTQEVMPDVDAASEADWSTEYLDLILSVRVVDGLGQAIRHIEQYGSAHTEAVITEDAEVARQFLARVDSSAVMVNASTRFNDGSELGLGAEIGISTSKLHAFGPMGLRELTTTKFIVAGDGQIRG